MKKFQKSNFLRSISQNYTMCSLIFFSYFSFIRFHPTRIGLVFYQHKQLNFPNHGYTRVIKKCDDKNAWDYEDWKAGKFIPTPSKLNVMKKLGFVFPENVETVEVKDVMKLARELTRQQYVPPQQNQFNSRNLS